MNTVSAPPPRNWRNQFARMWPSQYHNVPDLPTWAKDAIYCETVVDLSFADRIRVLLSGRLCVRSRTLTETRPGRVQSSSLGYPLPPKFLS